MLDLLEKTDVKKLTANGWVIEHYVLQNDKKCILFYTAEHQEMAVVLAELQKKNTGEKTLEIKISCFVNLPKWVTVFWFIRTVYNHPLLIASVIDYLVCLAWNLLFFT